jgi:hypothetical protein
MLASIVLAAVMSIASPAGPNSAEPFLTARPDGTLLMSWVEGNALKVAAYRNGKWSKPNVIVKRDDLFINWADFPSIVDDGAGTLFAHWLQKSGPGTYSYDVWVTSSRDGGKTWRTPRVLHRDGKQAEHGFVSLVPRGKGGVAAVWLDGREMTTSHDDHAQGAMGLRYTEIDAALRTSGEVVLDARVCECCTTAMTMTAEGPLVAYRDRSNEEIRDIGFTRRVKGVWTKPARVHPDNWKIAGCPVNGPQLDARGNRVAAAWFTAANNEAQVKVAFSHDAGATFGKPVRVDTGNAAGRVDVLLLADGSALVTWIEGAANNAGIFARRVQADGRAAAPVKLAATSSARSSGFPRATLVGKTAYLAWTDPAAKSVKLLAFE